MPSPSITSSSGNSASARPSPPSPPRQFAYSNESEFVNSTPPHSVQHSVLPSHNHSTTSPPDWNNILLLPNSTIPLNFLPQSSITSATSNWFSTDGWHGHHALLLVCLVILFAIVCKLIYAYCRKFIHFLPEPCLLILAGCLIDYIWGQTGDAVIQLKPQFTVEIFFSILLPPIMLESAYSLNRRPFYLNLIPILFYSILGTAINIVTIGPALFSLAQVDYSFLKSTMNIPPNLTLLELLLFGTALSAIDPVSVLALFKDLNVKQSLYYLVFGESLLNDAVVLVVHSILLNIFRSGETLSASVAPFVIGKFAIVSTGSLAIGLISGALSCLITKHTNKVRDVEPILILSSAYFAYVFAEIFQWSGVVSIIACGLIQSEFAFKNITEKSKLATLTYIKTLASVSDTVIFLFIGMLINQSRHLFNIAFIIFTVLFCILFRTLSVVTVSSILNFFVRTGIRIPWSEQLVMIHAGLRGAISFTLISLMKAEPESNGLHGVSVSDGSHHPQCQQQRRKPVVSFYNQSQQDGMRQQQQQQARMFQKTNGSLFHLDLQSARKHLHERVGVNVNSYFDGRNNNDNGNENTFHSYTNGLIGRAAVENVGVNGVDTSTHHHHPLTPTITQIDPDVGSLFETTGLAVIVFTVFFLGATTEPLLNALGIGRQKPKVPDDVWGSLNSKVFENTTETVRHLIGATSEHGKLYDSSKWVCQRWLRNILLRQPSKYNSDDEESGSDDESDSDDSDHGAQVSSTKLRKTNPISSIDVEAAEYRDNRAQEDKRKRQQLHEQQQQYHENEERFTCDSTDSLVTRRHCSRNGTIPNGGTPNDRRQHQNGNVRMNGVIGNSWKHSRSTPIANVYERTLRKHFAWQLRQMAKQIEHGAQNDAYADESSSAVMGVAKKTTVELPVAATTVVDVADSSEKSSNPPLNDSSNVKKGIGENCGKFKLMGRKDRIHTKHDRNKWNSSSARSQLVNGGLLILGGTLPHSTSPQNDSILFQRRLQDPSGQRNEKNNSNFARKAWNQTKHRLNQRTSKWRRWSSTDSSSYFQNSPLSTITSSTSIASASQIRDAQWTMGAAPQSTWRYPNELASRNKPTTNRITDSRLQPSVVGATTAAAAAESNRTLGVGVDKNEQIRGQMINATTFLQHPMTPKSPMLSRTTVMLSNNAKLNTVHSTKQTGKNVQMQQQHPQHQQHPQQQQLVSDFSPHIAGQKPKGSFEFLDNSRIEKQPQQPQTDWIQVSPQENRQICIIPVAIRHRESQRAPHQQSQQQQQQSSNNRINTHNHRNNAHNKQNYSRWLP